MRREPQETKITIQVMTMNAMWRFVGMAALAVITAFATFQDRIALGIGTIGLAATVVAGALVLIGAGAALIQSSPRATRIETATPMAALEDGDQVTTLGS